MNDKKTTPRTDKSTEHTSDDEPEVLILPRPQFTFDKIILVSTASKSRLEAIFPLSELHRLCPEFDIFPSSSTNAFYRSNLQFTYRPDVKFWDLLLEHEAKLGIYRFYQIELAFDFSCADEASALALGKKLAFSLRKPWHRRGKTEIQYNPNKPPRAGIIQGPTYYFEDGPASTRLKVYARYPKYGPSQDQPVARVEWTLKHADNIRSKTGIATIEDLLHFSSAEYFERWFRLERVDYEKLGCWLRRKRRGTISLDSCKHAVWALARIMTIHERRKMRISDEELSDFDDLEKLLLEKNLSPAALRGFIRTRRKEGQRRLYREVTYYKINQFFPPLEFRFEDE